MIEASFLKNDFPMLKKTMHGKPLCYLDSAATAQKPTVVIEAIDNFYRHHYGTVHRAVYELSIQATQQMQETRALVASFLNAEKQEEIIFTRGTTDSINLVANSFGKAFIKPGDEILITEMEHHSNIVPWQILCEDRGAILKVAPINDAGELIIEEFSKLLSKKTKITSVVHVSNALGTINPIQLIASLVHKTNSKLLIDGAQSAPHLPIDVRELGADFYAFSGHKVYGPTGIGILYGKEELLQNMPPYQGGGDMIETVTFEKTTYNKLPLKFEAGTPMIAEIIGLGAALNYIDAIGLKKIASHEHLLLKYATEKMLSINGLKIIGTAADKGGIISFIVAGTHPLDLGTLLDLKGVAVRTGHLCTQPLMRRFNISAMARVSFGLYNTKEDVDIFINALKEAIRSLT